MEVIKSLHTAILVSDLEAAAQFYEQVLGLERVNRPLKYPGIWYQIGDYQIHLIHQPDFTPVANHSLPWGRNPHIALGVKDLAAAKHRLEHYGYAYQSSASGRAALFTQDPDGNIIEITQA